MTRRRQLAALKAALARKEIEVASMRGRVAVLEQLGKGGPAVGSYRARVMDVFVRHPEHWLAPADVHAVLGGRIHTLRTTIRRLAVDGDLEHAGYGRYRKAAG